MSVTLHATRFPAPTTARKVLHFCLSSPMPSPPIPRSKSAPDITSQHSPSDVGKSVRTTQSTGSPMTTWPKKFGDYIEGKAKNLDLTEESLQEFNRRNALREARYQTSSPYYKGLTDFSLVINREKLWGSSPGRESHATSYISSGSKSSFIVKVQEWGSSCFTSKKEAKSSPSSSSFWTKSSPRANGFHDTRYMTSSPSSSSLKITRNRVMVTKIKAKTTKNDSESDRKKVTFDPMDNEVNIIPSTMDKPLGKRNSETPSMVPLPLPSPTASAPESLSYPLPQITPPPTAQEFTPLRAPISPPQLLYTYPPPATQAPKPWTPTAEGVEYEKKEINAIENERIYVWADKYRPFPLQDFICTRRTALWLQSMVKLWHDKAEECGHFIFEGNPGVGKRTMIWALLREAFGEDKVQAREECKKFYFKGEAVASILVNLMVSAQHVEVNLSELKGYEKHVIVELIKWKTPETDATLGLKEENHKAIILYEADKLSINALSYIKWMLGKFEGCNKVFFCCKYAQKLQTLKPLCTYVQLLEPSIEEILKVLEKIAKGENIHLPHQLANKIANNSKNNLRQAIQSFKATWHFNGCIASLREEQGIKTGWEDKIANIAKNVLEEQSPKQLYNIHGEIQNLIEHNVAPELIFQTLKEELEKILPEELQPQFVHLHDEYQV